MPARTPKQWAAALAGAPPDSRDCYNEQVERVCLDRFDWESPLPDSWKPKPHPQGCGCTIGDYHNYYCARQMHSLLLFPHSGGEKEPQPKSSGVLSGD